MRMTFRAQYLLIGVVLALLAFLMFGTGTLGLGNGMLWGFSHHFYDPGLLAAQAWPATHAESALGPVRGPEAGSCDITRWTLIVLAAIAVILFFNFPPLWTQSRRRWSQTMPKRCLDVNDVMNGWRPTYFPRNTGREMIHYYLTAAYFDLVQFADFFSQLEGGRRFHQPADTALHLFAG